MGTRNLRRSVRNHQPTRTNTDLFVIWTGAANQRASLNRPCRVKRVTFLTRVGPEHTAERVLMADPIWRLPRN